MFYKYYKSKTPTDKRVYTFYNPRTRVQFTGLRRDFYRKYNLNPRNVHNLVYGKAKSVKGWELKGYPNQSKIRDYIPKQGRRDTNIYIFYNHLTKEQFTGYRYDFIKQYNLFTSSVSNLIHGKVNCVKGWVLKVRYKVKNK